MSSTRSPWWKEHRKQAGPRGIWIGDLQRAPGQDHSQMAWIAEYVCDKKPEFVVQGGDWGDFPSLSEWDKGKKASELRRYQDDVNAVIESRKIFEDVLKRRRFKPKRKIITLGNHENRVNRAVEGDPKLEGKLSIQDMGFEGDGWEVVPFLQPIIIHDIAFAHFFPVSANGRVMQGKNGCPNARVQGQRLQKSCISGHMQGLDTAVITTPFGLKRSIIAGSCYTESHDYLTPQGNSTWQGIISINDIQPGGMFDVIEVSLHYLKRKYGQ